MLRGRHVLALCNGALVPMPQTLYRGFHRNRMVAVVARSLPYCNGAKAVGW